MQRLLELARNDDRQGFLCQVASARRSAFEGETATLAWTTWQAQLLQHQAAIQSACAFNEEFSQLRCALTPDGLTAPDALRVEAVMEDGGWKINEH